MSNYVELHATRNFSLKLNAIIEFIRYNSKPFGKAMVFIAGPFILLGSILLTQFMTRSLMQATANPGDMYGSLITSGALLYLGLGMIALLMGSVALISTVYEYLRLYEDKKSKDISVGEVWQRVSKNMWTILLTMFAFTAVLVGVYILFIVVMGIMTLIHPVLMVLAILALIPCMLLVMSYCMLVICIQVYERLSLSSSVKRASYLIKDHWWSTAGIFVITTILQFIIASAFMMPIYLISFASMMHSGIESLSTEEPSILFQVINYICYALYTMANYLLYSLPLLGIAFQYFNLVEKKEASGLMNRLETFGTSQMATEDEEHY